MRWLNKLKWLIYKRCLNCGGELVHYSKDHTFCKNCLTNK